ncbi:MAG: hypothetical protein ACRD7E_32930 [Bryobacteraceae bacterium]
MKKNSTGNKRQNRGRNETTAKLLAMMEAHSRGEVSSERLTIGVDLGDRGQQLLRAG